MDTVVLNAAIVAAILVVVKFLKIALESKWLVWLLKLIGHTEIVPYLAYALTVVVGILAGLLAYGADGLTIAEILQIIMDIIGANLSFKLIKLPGTKEG